MALVPVTRSILGTRALQRANLENSQFIEPTVELPGLVDTSLARLHNFLVGLYQDYYTKSSYIAIIGGQDTYPLPADCMKPRQVFYVDQSGYRWPIAPINLSDLTNVPISINYTSIPTGYVIMNDSIVMFPKPANTSVNQLQLFYIPEYTPAANDSTPIDFSFAFGWDEWVVYDVAYQMRLKAMMPADDLLRERDRQEAQIRHQANNRDAGNAKRVRDTGWNGRSPYYRYGNFAIKA